MQGCITAQGGEKMTFSYKDKMVPGAFIALMMSGQGATAQDETITIKFAMAVPPTHYSAVYGAKFFMDRATEKSDGRIAFEWYPAEQLGKAKDMLTLVNTGVVDMADVVPSYTPEKLPLTSVSELPGHAQTSCGGTEILYQLSRKDEFLGENEFGKQGVHPLMIATFAPYKILTKSAEVTEASDLAGVKLRASGGATEMTARALGAAPVRLAGPEVYQALTRGTIDGAIWPLLSLSPFDLTDEINFALTDPTIGTVSTAYLISDSSWEKIPADLQEILTEAGYAAAMNFCNYMDENESAELERLSHIKPTQITGEERERWDVTLNQVKDEWAARLDQQGKAGTAALEAWSAQAVNVQQ